MSNSVVTNVTTIYKGPWVNWSYGAVRGSTITLSARNGAILTSFIATFITIVGAQFWKILCLIFHQTRASKERKDGLYHQHQNILRNSYTPGGAAWSFALQSWYWWGRAHHSLLRSLPWALFSVFYLVAFALLSVFGSSEVTKAAGKGRLLQASRCGFWLADGSAAGDSSFAVQELVNSRSAAAYARDCYGGADDPLRCNIFASPHINWKANKANCPFKDSICYENNIYSMETGLVDSHHDLGVNTPENERLQYRKVTTCSVLRLKDYFEESGNSSGLVRVNYGPTTTSGNYTFELNIKTNKQRYSVG
jgi:hypothetical protein